MRARVLDFLRHGGDVEAFALELFRWQVTVSPVHRDFAAGVEPTSLHEIPAVPVRLCRALVFCTSRQGVTFRTSGTTGERGVHMMADTEAYDVAARLHFEACVTDPPPQALNLCPRAADSSLGHMMRMLFPDATADAPSGEGPVFVATTASRAAELPVMELPPGSVVMVTGGFKGDSPEHLDLRAGLGPHFRRIDEYGMTELSSQLWGAPGEGYLPPRWLVPYAVDPLSGEPTEGVGLLRFVDLANWSSLLAIETEDLGEVRGGRVFLQGRLQRAEPRGCSLAAE
ncbi:MAG TPA: hypothetical protein QGF58_25575 [Myxococcota bacterium]|nr:hypothetical protein [Myxococcota bacterium]